MIVLLYAAGEKVENDVKIMKLTLNLRASANKILLDYSS
jgi:hypothetical protein